MNTYFVYMLECADNSYYTGVTNDIDRRLYEHNDGRYQQSYTYSRRPVVLVYLKEFDRIEKAIALEKQIKGWTRVKKKALIAGDWDRLKALAACKNGTTHLRTRE